MSKGSVDSLHAFAKKLRELPTVLGHKVADAATAPLTELAQATFSAGTDAYGLAWEPGVDGRRITLKGKTGKLFDNVRYVSNGTKIRLKLGVDYAKYLVGKRPITPRQGAPLPKAYVETLTSKAHDTIRAELGTS